MSGPLVQALEKRRQEDLAKTQPLTPGTLEWAWAQAQKPFKGYWDRQGLMAREGLAMADQGAQQVRQGDLSGLAGMAFGPLNYLSSPINALFPIEEAQTQLPKSVSPFVAGGLELMALAAPGPKTKGLGRGVGALVDDVTDAERAALQSRLQTEATQTGGLPSSVTRDQALANLTEAPEGITAYHGSPHTFDKFDMSKIGTGEGAQAYGHGLYFAENEGVARTYKGAQMNNAEFVIDGKRLPSVGSKGADGLAAWALGVERGDKESAMARLYQVGTPEARAAHDVLKNAKNVEEVNPGSMYQVRLNVKPDELLDWDRPVKDQGDQVGNAVRKLTEGRMSSDFNGSEFHKAIAARAVSALDPASRGVSGADQVAAMEQMRAAGIKGIRYKDAGSRDKDGGTYNYVIFDDKLVDILKRYAIPFTLGAGGAAIVSGQDMPPEVASQLGPQA